MYMQSQDGQALSSLIQNYCIASKPLFVCPPDPLHHLKLTLESVAILRELIKLHQKVVEDTAR
jgi:hypothetical protein